MQRAFVESMKTIAQTAIEKAGFDKTRNGKIVGVNSITNTYSVRVDGIVYNNVKVVNDMTCNVGDTVKVNIPMNNPSQAYITSSILSDESIGQKIAQATTAIDDINNQIESIAEIANSIYQLSVDVSYANDGNYKNVTYTAMLMQDGVNVTEDHEASEFRWYLEKTTGTEELSGSPAWAVVLSTRDYFYGQSILLEWTYTYTDVISGEQKTTKLRSRVTLISNDAIQQVAKYTTEVTNGGVFVHRADGNYDVGADWESVWAYGVKIANTVDIIKGGKIYGSFGGDYLTIGNTSENNIYMDANSFIQLRKGNTVLTEIKPGSITLGNTSAGYYYTYIDSSNVKFRRNVNGTIRDIATFNSGGITLKNDNGINLMSLTSSGLNLYNGNSNSNVNIVSITNSGMTIRNANNQVLMSMSSNALNLYYIYSASTTYNVATFGSGGMTLRNTSGYTTFSASSNALNLYYYTYANGSYTNINVTNISTSGLTLRNSSNIAIFTLTNSDGRITSQNMASSSTNGYQRMIIGCNSATYGQPGVTFYKRYSDGTDAILEMRMNDVNKGGQITNDNMLQFGVNGWASKLEVQKTLLWSTYKLTVGSDRRIKQHISYLDAKEACYFIRYLKPALFYKNEVKEIGLYAQDVLSLDIWDVFVKRTDGTMYGIQDGLLSLDYTGIIMPLITYCQELEKRVENLEQKE